MNCIDAIEGSFKCLIHRFHQAYLDESLDDTVYIRNIRSVLEGLDDFIRRNRELQLVDEKILRNILYGYAREIWLKSIQESTSRDSHSSGKSAGVDPNEYHLYYFDYIYQNGMYPR
jgi:hypothetical protein